MFPADPFKSSQLGLVSSDQLRIACGIQGSFEPMRNAGGACAGSVKVAHACVHTTQAHDCIASQADRRTRWCAGPIMRAFQISLTGRCRLKMLGCEESTPATRSRPKFSSGRSGKSVCHCISAAISAEPNWLIYRERVKRSTPRSITPYARNKACNNRTNHY